ncbi:hypothetical protein F4780DRAFT_726343 [Xylariomycetidae sp. FL0641]|nr:hypothetical protein F4780DRAFT_726343 [Xylariomycetidae sp. FL0641]
MNPISLPFGFAESYRQSERYPQAIVLKNTYGDSRLKALYKRLRERSTTLFVPDSDTLVKVRDISAQGRPVKNNWNSEADIKEGLGTTGDIGTLATVKKEDPRCRFLFLVTDTATSPLQISSNGLRRILSYHQVTPNFLEFLDVYGCPSAIGRELRFSGFRSELYLQNPEPGLIIPELNRSGRHYQICFNVKAVFEKSHGDGTLMPWKLRQEAVHHQFDVGTGTQLFIFGDPHADMSDRIRELYSEKPVSRNYSDRFGTVSQSFSSSLEIHLQIARWATGGWRQYILSMEGEFEERTSKFIFQTDPFKDHLDTDDLFLVQTFEDKIHEAIMVLESNVDTIASLLAFYREVVEDEDFPMPERAGCQRSVRKFGSRANEVVCDLRMQIRRAKVLAKQITDKKAIFNQLLQTQVGARAEGLSSVMWRQAEKTSQEAIAMRVVTFITLLYLPPTFISTVFSTDLVNFEADGADSMQSSESLALQRFLQVALPLMVLTFCGAYCWMKYENGMGKKEAARLEDSFPDLFAKTRALLADKEKLFS